MIQLEFANHVTEILKEDLSVIGLAVGGSWITQELDQFSDLDLILVTGEKISDDKTKMLDYARRFGKLLTGFTGEHVGEPRLLICLYDSPLLHVDIKFLTPEEFHARVETPVLLFDRDRRLQSVIQQSDSKFPYPDYQWLEDRFWIWIHYALLKIGRGEYFEALDFLGFLRMVVLGPLVHIKNGNLPRGVRKVETQIEEKDLAELKSTVPAYEKDSLLNSLKNAVSLYKNLRRQLFPAEVMLHGETEEKVMMFFTDIKNSGASGIH